MLFVPALAPEPHGPSPTFTVETLHYAEAVGRMIDLSGVDLVIAPLHGSGFDAAAVIDWLGRAAFRGRMRVVTQPLADRDRVLRDLLARAAPLGIAVELFEAVPEPRQVEEAIA